MSQRPFNIKIAIGGKRPREARAILEARIAEADATIERETALKADLNAAIAAVPSTATDAEIEAAILEYVKWGMRSYHEITKHITSKLGFQRNRDQVRSMIAYGPKSLEARGLVTVHRVGRDIHVVTATQPKPWPKPTPREERVPILIIGNVEHRLPPPCQDAA